MSDRDRRSRDPDAWIHRPIERYRKPAYALDYRPGPEFFAIADRVVQDGRTLLGYDRLYVLWQAVGNVAGVLGAVAEVGSFRGGSAYFIADAFRALTGEEADIEVFDTFEGHPQSKVTDSDPFHSPGQFGGTDYERVKAYLAVFSRLRVHQGEVSEKLPLLEPKSYRLVHIDTDLYAPTLDCLEYFGPNLTSGGIFVLDDYAAKKCPGVHKAAGEYLSRTDAFQIWDMRTEQLMLVKR
jgi:O-methyltransferase